MPQLARVVSLEGEVELRREDDETFSSARLDQVLCEGDTVRVGPLSRAQLALANESVLRLDEQTLLRLKGTAPEERSLLDLLVGAVYFFSHRPRALEIDTPFVNAGTEGTEFLIRVDEERTEILLFQGIVLARNPVGELRLEDGEAAVAEAGEAPRPEIVVRPRDAVAWAIYYPPLTADLAAEPLPPALAAAAERVAAGDLAGALAELDRVPEAERDADHYTYRAAVLLNVGRVEAAATAIEQALALDPAAGEALAHRAILALARNEPAAALADAREAVRLRPEAGTASIALSYALQANFALVEARDGLREALARRPDDALAWARLAELELALGERAAALAAAERAVDLAPQLGRTQMVLGFAALARIDVAAARAAFTRAIELDPANPLPRLGLGLARIRQSDLAAGRHEIEIAAGLDPSDALIRSYLGKAYFEERRDDPAAIELETAKGLDPNDPTPWFYDAIRKQLDNRPVEALADLETAIALNDNRAVYRSRLLLDEDLASRSASLARIYADLGFDQVALLEGWKSVGIEAGNHSAHRFLADAYASLPRHEIARVSELLQAQLRQPINITPIQPQLAESNLQIIAGTGPSAASFSEFHPLFARDGLSILANGVAGSNSTFGNDLIVSGIKDRLSFSLGQFHFRSDGFRPNNDLEHNIFNGLFQMQLTPSTSVQAEMRHTKFERGDLPLRFDPDNFADNLRQEDQITSGRIGFRHLFAPHSDLVASVQAQRAHFDAAFRGVSSVERDEDGHQLELQHLYRWPWLTLLSGAGRAHVDRETSLRVTGLPSLPPAEEDIRHDNFYLYSYSDLFDRVQLTLGLSADFLEGATVDRDQVNPKVGVIWTPWGGTTVRAAAFRTLTRTLISSQTIEPTQVAGFNQLFDDAEGTDAWRYGVALEQRLSDVAGAPLYAGAEFSHRDLTVPGFIPLPAPQVVREDFKEDLVRAYLYWAPHPWWGLRAEYAYERFDRDIDLVGPEDFTELRTHRFALGAAFAHPSGLRAGVTGTYVTQDGEFGTATGGIAPGDDRFWVLDLSAGYRLPQRRGLITLIAKNVFDQDFRFQDTDPARPRLVPERQVVLRVSLFF